MSSHADRGRRVVRQMTVNNYNSNNNNDNTNNNTTNHQSMQLFSNRHCSIQLMPVAVTHCQTEPTIHAQHHIMCVHYTCPELKESYDPLICIMCVVCVSVFVLCIWLIYKFYFVSGSCRCICVQSYVGQAEF